MNEETLAIIAHVIDRAPQWLRHDLAAKDVGPRRRAEETLAAMIADALTKGNAADNKEA